MFNRAANARVQTTREVTFPAPVKGWVQSGNVASAGMDQAEVLDNFFPTAQSARLRGGSSVYADIGAPIVRLMTYSQASDRIFAATDGGIFDADAINAGGAVTAGVAAASGDWSAQQISTAGGDYLVVVNGADSAQYFDGTTWAAITAVSAPVAITGVPTSDLSQVWLHQSRIWFVEKNTLSAWYLPAASIGGAAAEFDLGAVFKRGGHLLFGASWSLDTGAGMDDVCVFVTANGEIAVYEGTDPSNASTWRLSGVYDISRPLNKHAFFKAGGDLAILTEDGIVPVSEALKKDRAALQAVAITYPIEDAWKASVANRSTEFPITPTLWQSQAMLMIGVPGRDRVAYVANARTGAWCRFIGWDVRCGAVANDRLYFGTSDGRVMRGMSGGTDNGVAYYGHYVPKFSTLGGQGLKMANHAGLTFRASGQPAFEMTAFRDYQVGAFPIAAPQIDAETSLWGGGVWGEFVWGGASDARTYTQWKTVRASGFSIAPALAVTSNKTSAPFFEILATRLRFEAAQGF